MNNGEKFHDGLYLSMYLSIYHIGYYINEHRTSILGDRFENMGPTVLCVKERKAQSTTMIATRTKNGFFL